MATETPVGTARKIDRGTTEPCPVRVDADGVWHVSDFVNARALLRSTETRQAGFGIESSRNMGNMRPPVLYRDGVEHREHRRQTAKFFTPRRVDEKYRDLMHRYAQQEIDRLQRLGRADLSRLSFTLAVAVAGEVIGLATGRGTARRLERFFDESEYQPSWKSPGSILRLIDRNWVLAAYYFFDVRPAIRARRRERRDDLISHLIDEGCRNPEILGECVTFGAAGMITTREFITLAAWHLFSDEALRKAYTAGDAGTRVGILHEILRLEPVVSDLLRRTTAEVEVGDETIPAGAKVDVSLASANMDTSVVGPDPGQVCPGRELPDAVGGAVLSFGDGPHRCPGAHIAIQETEIFLTKLFALPNLRLVSAPQTRLRAGINSYEISGTVVAVD